MIRNNIMTYVTSSTPIRHRDSAFRCYELAGACVGTYNIRNEKYDVTSSAWELTCLVALSVRQLKESEGVING